MALTKAKKAVQIDQLAHELEGSTSAIVGTFAKLTVSQDFELRKVVRSAGGRYRVLKNKLAARAVQGNQGRAGAAGAEGRFLGGLYQRRPGGPGQGALHLDAGERRVHLQAGHCRRQVSRLKKSSSWRPCRPRRQIFSKLLFLINAPAQRLVTVMNAAGRDLAVVVNQAVEQGKFAAPARGAEPSRPPSGTSSAANRSQTPEAEPAAEAPAEVLRLKQLQRQQPQRSPKQLRSKHSRAAAVPPKAPAGEAAAETGEDSQTEPRPRNGRRLAFSAVKGAMSGNRKPRRMWQAAA